MKDKIEEIISSAIWRCEHDGQYDEICYLSKYVEYLEQLVFGCSDCPDGYNLDDLRKDFTQDIKNGY